jgi:hypothetical protein
MAAPGCHLDVIAVSLVDQNWSSRVARQGRGEGGQLRTECAFSAGRRVLAGLFCPVAGSGVFEGFSFGFFSAGSFSWDPNWPKLEPQYLAPKWSLRDSVSRSLPVKRDGAKHALVGYAAVLIVTVSDPSHRCPGCPIARHPGHPLSVVNSLTRDPSHPPKSSIYSGAG